MKRLVRIPAGRISKSGITEILKGSKSYVSLAVTKELKAAGMGRMAQRASSGRADVTRAVKLLQKKGLMPKGTSAHRLARRAETQQKQEYKAYLTKKEEMLAKKAEEKQAKLDEEKQKHIRINIAMDITDELMEEERENDPLGHRLKNIRGKRIVDEIQEEQQQREKKAAEEKEKMQELYNPQGPKRQTSKPMDTSKLSDMDID